MRDYEQRKWGGNSNNTCWVTRKKSQVEGDELIKLFALEPFLNQWWERHASKTICEKISWSRINGLIFLFVSNHCLPFVHPPKSARRTSKTFMHHMNSFGWVMQDNSSFLQLGLCCTLAQPIQTCTWWRLKLYEPEFSDRINYYFPRTLMLMVLLSLS